ncbi:MAG: hypothetical protein ACREQV_03580 [Candidatus Binatia bacterium]
MATAYLAIIDIPHIPLPFVIRMSGGVLAVVIAVIFLGVSNIESPRMLDPPNLEQQQPPPEQIAQAREDVSRRYTKQQIDHFFYMLTDLPSHLVRVSEEAELEERNLRVTTKLTYQYLSQAIKKSQEEKLKTLLIPLATPRKGTLIDGLRVIDSSGDEITTLSQYDTRGLLVLTLETLFRLAIKEGPTSSDLEPNELSTNEEDALDKLVEIVCHVGHLTDDYCRKNFVSLRELPRISYEWALRLEGFCRLYATHYAIVAEVTRPSSNQVSLAYSQRLHTENSATTYHDRLRRRLGLSPYTIDLPLALYAFLADSYHLQINAGSGQYIFDHHLEEMRSRTILKQEDLIDKPDPQIGKLVAQPYVRTNENGRTNAHLYIRRQRPVIRMAELKSVFEFREVPPGTLGGAAVVAGASAVIITFFALTHFGLHGPEPGKIVSNNEIVKAALNSDLPAILLSLPAFVAALIGPWSDLSRITRASLSTYFGLVTTLLLSVTSVLYYILDANVMLPTEVDVSILGGASLNTDIIWLILMFVALSLFSHLVRELTGQSRYYFKLVEHRLTRRPILSRVRKGKQA